MKNSRMDEWLRAWRDLGSSINSMPFPCGKKLTFQTLLHLAMTLEIADRSISRPIVIAKMSTVEVGYFQIPIDLKDQEKTTSPAPKYGTFCLSPSPHGLMDLFNAPGTTRDTLKKKLTEALILIAPDWDQPFELMCDASDYAIGAVLGATN
ncbi:reverse transcriptase domain-containing protein [Tanacetum coccineum]